MIHYTDIINGNPIIEKYFYNLLNKRDLNLQIDFILHERGIDTIGFAITMDSKIYPIIRRDKMICCEVELYGVRKGLYYDQDHIIPYDHNNISIIVKQIIYEVNTFLTHREENLEKLITAYFIADKYEPKDYVYITRRYDLK